ncbi:hypothetical protein M011DRAFT_258177 [Sporormia fimetaria CBS 119925]|uniref:Uncharacterized protein n=1 Tax=Sporormia fimetaria CBS 119925 TaxID=1340428 RepID=A0A6A6UYJ7_9PLEO|nr:hypothetical protein M011DRAFT_258177 [Sporormia fimetaria CBS 119925]
MSMAPLTRPFTSSQAAIPYIGSKSKRKSPSHDHRTRIVNPSRGNGHLQLVALRVYKGPFGPPFPVSPRTAISTPGSTFPFSILILVFLSIPFSDPSSRPPHSESACSTPTVVLPFELKQ